MLKKFDKYFYNEEIKNDIIEVKLFKSENIIKIRKFKKLKMFFSILIIFLLISIIYLFNILFNLRTNLIIIVIFSIIIFKILGKIKG